MLSHPIRSEKDRILASWVLEILGNLESWRGYKNCPVCRGQRERQAFDYCDIGYATMTYTAPDGWTWRHWESWWEQNCAQHFSFILFGEVRRTDPIRPGRHMHGILFGWQCSIHNFNAYAARILGNFKLSRWTRANLPSITITRLDGTQYSTGVRDNPALDDFIEYSTKHHTKQHTAHGLDDYDLPIYIKRQHKARASRFEIVTGLQITL